MECESEKVLLAKIEVKLEKIQNDLRELEALERRIESLENYQSFLKGFGTMATALFTAIVSWLIYHVAIK